MKIASTTVLGECFITQRPNLVSASHTKIFYCRWAHHHVTVCVCAQQSRIQKGPIRESGLFYLHPHLTKHFFDCPHVIGEARFYCGGNSEGLVNPAEIVMHVVERDRVQMVLHFLAESVR